MLDPGAHWRGRLSRDALRAVNVKGRATLMIAFTAYLLYLSCHCCSSSYLIPLPLRNHFVCCLPRIPHSPLRMKNGTERVSLCVKKVSIISDYTSMVEVV